LQTLTFDEMLITYILHLFSYHRFGSEKPLLCTVVENSRQQPIIHISGHVGETCRLAISSAEAHISGVIRNMKRGSVVEHETPHQARVHTTAAVGVHCRRLSSCCTTWPSGWRPIEVSLLWTMAPPAIRPALDAMHVEVFLLPRSKQVERPIIVYWCHLFVYNCLFPIQK
jgi:hypothetical protein